VLTNQFHSLSKPVDPESVVKIFVNFVKELLFGAKVQKNITKTINGKFGIFYDIYLRK